MKQHSQNPWVKKLRLIRHPEGGFYSETYRSAENIPANALPARFKGRRSISTAIYYLLEKDDFSAFHRIRSDEIWHFYSGSTLLIHVIDQKGKYSIIRLGDENAPQAVVSAGCWFAAEISPKGRYALVGCTVAPGFDFADFELGTRRILCKLYPRQRNIISRLTRQ